jgi:hypothetical protein
MSLLLLTLLVLSAGCCRFPCQSEYVAACDERRSYLSNFTGSAGTAVVTNTAALLWTDGRYYLQASQQLSAEWTLMKAGQPDTPTLEVRVPSLPSTVGTADSQWNT